MTSSCYRFGSLAPVRSPGAGPINQRLLGAATLGIEVTEPELALQCGLGNLDPQHGPDGVDMAAIEGALHWPLPARGSTLVTLRADPDSTGAMAVLELRARGQFHDEMLPRIGLIARCDSFRHGSWRRWQARHPLPPSRARSTHFEGPALEYRALGQAIRRQGLNLQAAVELTGRWLMTGELASRDFRAAIVRQRRLVQAWNARKIVIRGLGPGLAHVRSDSSGALSLGYCVAPVVIAERGLCAARKVTIAKFDRGWIDLQEMHRQLNALEPGWGGSPSILGSPQGVPCRLPMSLIQALVVSEIERSEDRLLRGRQGARSRKPTCSS
jgi:hypothetical protein